MQLSLKCSSVVYAEVYTEILDDTLMWFPGLVYVLSSLLTAVAVVPVRYKNTAEHLEQSSLNFKWSTATQIVFLTLMCFFAD